MLLVIQKAIGIILREQEENQEIDSDQRIARRIWMQKNLVTLINEISYHRTHRSHYQGEEFQVLWPDGELRIR